MFLRANRSFNLIFSLTLSGEISSSSVFPTRPSPTIVGKNNFQSPRMNANTTYFIKTHSRWLPRVFLGHNLYFYQPRIILILINPFSFKKINKNVHKKIHQKILANKSKYYNISNTIPIESKIYDIHY